MASDESVAGRLPLVSKKTKALFRFRIDDKNTDTEFAKSVIKYYKIRKMGNLSAMFLQIR